MRKQVNGGQDAGDLGIENQLAGQKHDPSAKRFKGEKGKGKMQGAGGEMVVGDRVATRSVSTAMKARQDPLSSSESDELLYKMFKEWAIRNEKIYKTADEENKRFKIWCATKERLDVKNSRQKPGGPKFGLLLFSDQTEEELGRYFMRPCFPIPRETPTIQAVSDKKVAEHNKMAEKKDAEEEAFDKWVADQKRNYGNEFERKIGFNMYRTNTRWIKSLLKEDLGKYSTSLIELGILLDQVMTLSEVESLLNGFTQNVIGSAAEGGFSSYNRRKRLLKLLKED